MLGLEFDIPSGIFWEIENPPGGLVDLKGAGTLQRRYHRSVSPENSFSLLGSETRITA
jgi:hypothetical protein